jgi:hypothetical protein
MSARRTLANRRPAETFKIEVEGLRFTVTVGIVAGKPVEVFISNHKAGNASDVAARDAGILLSILLQMDCPIDAIAHSITRNADGSPSGVVGAVVDEIIAGGNRR